jgi:TolA-binding protein
MKAVGITCLLLTAMPLAFPASKEIIELQRDVAQLQDQARNLQKTLDQLTVLAQQALDAANRNNASIAVMQSNLGDTTKGMRDTISAPMVNVGTKMDALSEDFRNLRETVADVSARLGKLDSKVTDVQNAVAIISRPQPAPPPGPEGATASSGVAPGPTAGGTPPPSPTAPATPPPGLKSETLYSNAYRDYTGGNYDVALGEFSDYIKYFNETQFAPNSQFYIGNIYYKKQDYPNALAAFDAVLEHYSDNPKTAGAHYWKGKTLLAMGKRDAAAKEFREILSKYSTSDVAPLAKTELRNLGLSPGTGAATKGRSRRTH